MAKYRQKCLTEGLTFLRLVLDDTIKVCSKRSVTFCVFVYNFGNINSYFIFILYVKDNPQF